MLDLHFIVAVGACCLLADGTTTATANRLLSGDIDERGVTAVADPLSETVDCDSVDAVSTSTPSATHTLTPSLLQAAAAPTPPAHSGFRALFSTTAGDFAAFPRRRSTWVILGIGGAAAAIAYPFDDEVHDSLQDADGLRTLLKPGKYLGHGWVHGGAAVGLYLVGRYAMTPDEGRRTNKVSHLGFDLLRATVVTQAFTYGIKATVRRDRPTGECCAFPSGHASITFATAAVLERHFGYRLSWPMFAVAGYVAASRLTDNRHFLSDVLFGSALGIATGWTVVGRHGRKSFSLVPVPVRGGVALAGTWSPGHTRPTIN